MNEWLVYLKNGRLFDQVFFDKTCDEEYVRTSLINHDGYPSTIRVILRG